MTMAETRYEYTKLTLNAAQPDTHLDALNELGDQGWAMIGASATQRGNELTVWFMRQKLPAEPPPEAPTT